MHYRELKKRIKKNEGFSLKPYKDQLGCLTIGYGHLILPNETHLLKNKTNKPQLNSIFDQDFERALGDYKRFIKQKHHNRKDKELLIEMTFYYVTRVDNINTEQLMSQEQYVFQNKDKMSKIFSLKF